MVSCVGSRFIGKLDNLEGDEQHQGSPGVRERSRSRHSTRIIRSNSGSNKSNGTNRTNNVYNALKDDVQDSEMDDDFGNTRTRGNPSNNVTKSVQIPTTSAEKSNRPPPITFKFTDITKVRKILTDTTGIDAKTTHIRITEHGIKVQLSDDKQYDMLIDKCKKLDDVLFFTHTKKQERKVKFCLYGLWSMSTEELHGELKSLGICARVIEEMPIYERKYSDQCIYKLTFFNEDHMNVTRLRQIRYVFSCSIRWQYFKGKNYSITRCTNCQEWGHGENNCYSKTKCSRCAGDHKSSQCTHPKDSNNKIPANLVKCANCGGNHTAGFSGCRARQNYEAIQKRMRENSRMSTKNRPSVPLNDNVNFPPVTQQRRPQFVDAPPPRTNFWNNRSTKDTQHQQNLLSADECLQAMNELLDELSKCQTRNQQIRAIGAIAIKYTYGFP